MTTNTEKTAIELAFVQLSAALGREPTAYQAFVAGVNFAKRTHDATLLEPVADAMVVSERARVPSNTHLPRVDNFVITALRRQRQATMNMARHHYANHQFHLMFKMIKRARQLNKDVVFFQKHGNPVVR